MRNKLTKEAIQESGSFWRKIRDFKLTAEEFERVEALEGAVAKYEDEIIECQKEIKDIERIAKARLV